MHNSEAGTEPDRPGIKTAQGRANILHSGGQRRVTVAFNVSGRLLQDVVSEAEQRVAMSMPHQEGVISISQGKRKPNRPRASNSPSIRERP